MKSLSMLMIAIGVMAGAFGAHILSDIVTAERLEVFKTGVMYQITMSIVLLILASQRDVKFNWLKPLLFSGIVIFSGSLYILVIFDLAFLGAITPIGGIIIISSLLTAAWKFR